MQLLKNNKLDRVVGRLNFTYYPFFMPKIARIKKYSSSILEFKIYYFFKLSKYSRTILERRNSERGSFLLQKIIKEWDRPANILEKQKEEVKCSKCGAWFTTR